MQYVGFWRRFVAALLDGIILSVLGGILGALLGGESVSFTAGGFSTNWMYIVLSILYSVGYQGYAGQTLGKKVMGIKVVDEKGQKPSYFTFFLREIIGKFVSAIILFIGYLMVIWDSKKQGLHDKIASTYVVRM